MPLEQIDQRGYRTVSDPDELLQLDFAEYQCRVPALLIPLHGPDGSNHRYAIKPDFPRTGKDGRVRKYEYPAGSPHMLDVPPGCLEQVKDAAAPMMLTEGAPKADVAAGLGFVGINVWGVHSWYRNPEHGGFATIEPLEDWKHIPLDGRICYLGFDSDAFSKESVSLALRRLASFLTRRGALVYIVHLPDEPDGSKNGLDDFVARHGADAFLDLVDKAEAWGSSGMVKKLQARVRELEDLQAATLATLHNDSLTAAERIVAVSAVCQTQSRASRGYRGPIRVTVDAPKNPDNPYDQERVGLAADIGLSKNTVRRALDHVFADDAPIVKRTIHETNVDGMPRAYIALEPKCTTGVPGMLWQLAGLKPAPVEPKSQKQRCIVETPHIHKCTEICTVTGVVEEHDRKVNPPRTQNEYEGDEDELVDECVSPDTQNEYEGNDDVPEPPLGAPSHVLNATKMGTGACPTCAACGIPQHEPDLICPNPPRPDGRYPVAEARRLLVAAS